MLGHKLVEILSGEFKVGTTMRQNSLKMPIWYQDILEKVEVFENVDAQDFNGIERSICQFEPDVVINCIGIIKQVKEAYDYVTSLEINSLLPHRLSNLTGKYGFRLILLSTDCVFDGEKGNFLEDDAPNPPDLYGKSKLLGEVSHVPNVLTLRTSIMGRELYSQNSLLEWFLSEKEIKGFSKVFFSGFPTVTLSRIIKEKLLNSNLSGLYHLSSEGISKGELLYLLNDEFSLGKKIKSVDLPLLDRTLNGEKIIQDAGVGKFKWKDLIFDLDIDNSNYNKE